MSAEDDDKRLHARANAYGLAITHDIVERLPTTVEMAATLRRTVAMAFVVGYAAGMEQAAMPRRTVPVDAGHDCPEGERCKRPHCRGRHS